MTGFTSFFSSGAITPSNQSAGTIDLIGDISLAWPVRGLDPGSTLYQQMVIEANSGVVYDISVDDATLVSNGQNIIFYNRGNTNFTVSNFNQGNLATITPGQAIYLFLQDNSTSSGVWIVFTFGTGTSSADASMLAGQGLLAIGGTLNVNTPTNFIVNIPYTVQVTDRGGVIYYTGGSNSFTLPSPSSLGFTNGFVTALVNGSTTGGALTVTVADGSTINGETSIVVGEEQSCYFVSGGVGIWSCIGLGEPSFNISSVYTRDLSASVNVTLTSNQAANTILIFTGTTTADVSVYLPALVNEWAIYNGVAGGHRVFIQLSNGSGGGTGTAYTMNTNDSYGYYCDGLTLYDYTNGNINLPALGTGVTYHTSGNNFLTIAVPGTDYYSPGNPTTLYDDTNTTGDSNVGVGSFIYGSLAGGNQNTVLGAYAGVDLQDGNQNICVGYVCGSTLVHGNYNTLMGANVGSVGDLGTNNTFIGTNAGYEASGCSDNVCIGNNTGYNINGYGQNVIVGSLAGSSTNWQVSQSVVIGYFALGGTTANPGSDYIAIGTHSLDLADGSGSHNIGIGQNAGGNIGGSSNVVAIGYLAGNISANDTISIGYNSGMYSYGGNGIFIGSNAGNTITGGGNNTIVGVNAASGSANSGYLTDDNTIVGTNAMGNVTAGPSLRNSVLGSYAGNGVASGNDNVIVGYTAMASGGYTFSSAVIVGSQSSLTSTAASNSIVVGYGATAGSASSIVIGFEASSSTGNVLPIAIGASAQANATAGIAIGANAVVSGINSIIIGSAGGTVSVLAANCVAIGALAAINNNTYTGSVSVGYSSSATGANAVALGVSASAAAGSVCIGHGVTTSTANVIKLGNAQFVGVGSTSDPLYTLDLRATSTRCALSIQDDGTPVSTPAIGYSVIQSVSGHLQVSNSVNRQAIITANSSTTASATCGTSVAMTAGVVTISTTAVTSTSKIFLTYNTFAGTVGVLEAKTADITAGSSFVIRSSLSTDTSTVNWLIVNPV